MSGKKQDQATQLSAYRARERHLALAGTVDSTRLIRRMVSLGPRAAMLGLDQVPGIVRVQISDHGAEGVEMPQGQVHVEVWGGRAADIYAALQRNRTLGVVMTIRVRRAMPWHSIGGWLRWQLFRLFGDPRREGP